MTDDSVKPSVRAARHSDVQALAVVWQELMELHEHTDERFALALDAIPRWQALAHETIVRHDGFLFAAEIGGEVVGFCLGWLAKNPVIYRVAEIGFVSEIAVRRVWQRKGVGRALMAAARAWFRARHVTEFQLSTAVWNQEACAFWQATGGEPLLLRYRFEVDEPPLSDAHLAPRP